MTRFDVARTQQPKSTAAYGSLRFGPLRYQLKRTIGMLPTPDNSECSRQIGATDYLSKPADATDITNALLATGDDLPPPPENPMSADRVRWEHIQRVYELCDRNVSETARRLNMHRRTLQRILAKRSPR